jgi:hypothetical protein
MWKIIERKGEKKMVFWIFVVLAIAFFIMAHFYVLDLEDLWVILGAVATTIGVVMLVIVIALHCGSKGTSAEYRERYKALVYKSETEACRDKFGIVNKNYIDEVQNWNENLSYNKEVQRDFWIGIFIPNIYDEFQTIDLNSIEYKTD